ncbi:RNA ligase [Bacillus sp. FJAT-42376]|uniref:RNA ligase n=1 Tax=Bacillus sp. FJAT-42376 TaxID=2014076 RepID=UPI0013DE3F29|nr:RNA ligase [Bacillus sp. FJAT-42376]
MFPKDQYMKEVESKFITRRHHPEHPHIVILNYTEHATYEKRWNEVTLHCRGLIIDEASGEVLARPFPKFFNHGEMPELESEIPFSETPEFTVKQDGSLGICYRVNDKLYWATRGSFESEQAKAAQQIWDRQYAHVQVPHEITLLVEIIHPATRVVVDYNGMSDLIIIGAINRFTGHDYPYNELQELGKALGMQVTEQIKLTVEEAIKLKETIDHNSEGWVLRWPNGMRLKIKGSSYLDIHKIAYGLSDKLKTEYWSQGKMDELILKMPEEFRTEIERFTSTLDQNLNDLSKMITDHYSNASVNSSDRKSFAMYVNQHVPNELKYLVFKKADAKLHEEILKEHIYKHYLQYIGRPSDAVL